MTSEMSAVERLKMLTARASERRAAANTAADLVVAADQMTSEALSGIQDLAETGDAESRGVLAQLEAADAGMQNDAFLRQAFLIKSLIDLSKDERPDPKKFLALLFGAMGKRLKNGQPALPVLRVVKMSDQSWKRQRTIFVRAYKDPADGTISTRGLMPLVPASVQCGEAFEALRSARKKAALRLVEELEGETLANLSRAVWHGLYLIERGRICPRDEVEKLYETQDGKMVLKSDHSRTFNFFALSPKEWLIFEHSGIAKRLCDALYKCRESAERFWAGKENIEEKIRQIVREHNSKMITPAAFLEGKPGIVAVSHDAFKDREATAKVAVLLERLEGLDLWRWTVCNPEGVKALFGGKRLSFHEFNSAAVPGHIRRLLREGQIIAG